MQENNNQIVPESPESNERETRFREELSQEMKKLEVARRKALMATTAKMGCGIIGAAFLGAAMWAGGIMGGIMGSEKPKKPELTPQEKINVEESKRRIGRMLSPLVLGSIGIKTNEFDIKTMDAPDIETARRRLEATEKELAQEKIEFDRWEKEQREKELKKKLAQEKIEAEQETQKKMREREQRMRGRR